MTQRFQHSSLALSCLLLVACPEATPADSDIADTRTPDTNTPDTTSPDAPDSRDTSETHDPMSDAMRIHLLDVGQGEAIIVEFPCGAMLIDTGGEVTPASAAAPAFDSDEALESQIRAFFAGRPDLDHTFDVVVLSHPHLDHTRGVTRLIEMVDHGELTIKNVVTNGIENVGSGVYQQRALHDFADTHAIPRWYVLERKARPDGFTNDIIDPFVACTRNPDATPIDPKITALWGRIDNSSDLRATWNTDDLDSGNNHSVVLRIDFGEASALLPGDLEEAGITELVRTFGPKGLIDVDLYKAGHHGSYNGTTAALVNAMSPEVAVISAGPAHRTGDWTAWAFGLPRWRAVSDMLGDTDSDGVAASRLAPITAPIATHYANGHGVFVDKPIAPAVYCTAWDGSFSIKLYADGVVALPD